MTSDTVALCFYVSSYLKYVCAQAYRHGVGVTQGLTALRRSVKSNIGATQRVIGAPPIGPWLSWGYADGREARST
ncbi:MAG TPA: hypothetical protein VFT58_03710 [Nitrososphaera sp.]|nr:hypothetical protein [Nitrososphaera sp.]